MSRPSPRWRLSYELIQRGAPTTLALRLTRGTAPVVPSAVTVRVIGPDSADVLPVIAATPGATSTYAWVSPSADLELGEGYVLEWTATVDGVAYVYTVPGIMVLRLVDPIITDEDVYRRWPHLDPSKRGAITREPTHQDQIDEAWNEIQTLLIASGRRPWMLATAATLRSAHLTMAGAIIMESVAARGGVAGREDAERLRQSARDELDRAIIQYADDEGRAAEPEPAARGHVYLSGRRGRNSSRWW